MKYYRSTAPNRLRADICRKERRPHMDSNKTPKPGRMEALREFPAEVMRSLTKEEIKAFLYEDVWPNSLREKLRDYMVEDG